MNIKLSAQDYQNELIFYPYNYYGSFGQGLDTDNRIFMKPYIKKNQSCLSIVKNCLIKMF